VDKCGCKRDEDNGARAYEAVRLRRGVKYRGQFVHQGYDGYGQPGKPYPAIPII